MWFILSPRKTEPQVIVGVLNGQFRNAEANNDKTISVELKWNQPWGQCGASWLDGKWTNDIGLPGVAPVTDRNAVLGYVRWAPPKGPVAFQGEYVQGELLGNDINGWYAQAERPGTKPATVGFLKYESYDPNEGAANDSYTAWHVGYANDLDENNRVTVQYDNGKNRGAAGDQSRNGIGVQWQLFFSG